MNITKLIKEDMRTSKEYLNGFVSTIESGNKDAKINEDVIKNINVNELNAKCEEAYASTHMAGNAIYSKEFYGNYVEKMDKPYDRAKAKKNAKQLAEEQLDEESEMLNM